uniref:Uncharacterized protein n=1 Tax=Glossina pallidipes TaxID=7398 RepID=A0A1B0A4C4_GLOPL
MKFLTKVSKKGLAVNNCSVKQLLENGGRLPVTLFHRVAGGTLFNVYNIAAVEVSHSHTPEKHLLSRHTSQRKESTQINSKAFSGREAYGLHHGGSHDNDDDTDDDDEMLVVAVAGYVRDVRCKRSLYADYQLKY